ncbi:glycosyltransferase [Flavobacterium crassostreae]|uniref:Glycosyltransferase n=1 Tax=Flavobacterium crassostreae TaxID=1763534 RepID=A0A1B9E4I2_9FLAO|nr:glycosyltransferase [Flavobacterium crassostreae]OCB76837.1 glycosyltransferase [Flavobacterium crassostreae]
MMVDTKCRTILVAPLNWGLGHATRCIPIIKALQDHNYIPIIASDGAALQLLKKEFPYLKALQLPSYEIEYAKKATNFKWKLLQNSPKTIAAIWREKKLVTQWVEKYALDGIISDNRLGVVSQKVPSVFVTHQLNVMTGSTTWFTSKIHQYFIKKYSECWVPDTENTPNLAGTLSHVQNPDFKIKYLGPISRMHKKSIPIKYDLMVILSGPEPQRTFLEKKLKAELQNFTGRVVFIRGVLEKEQRKEQIQTVTYYNFMNSRQLEQTFNESKMILCRSGYTTIMDLVKLEKKAFFIPTPGQFEQLYLAEKLQKEGLIPFAEQDLFTITDLKRANNFKGLRYFKTTVDWEKLFELFKTT